jgi:hypothetical protein
MAKKWRLNALEWSLVAVGGLFLPWAAAAIISGLHRVNWQVGELAHQYLVASGMIQPLHTLVDFYTHIKGIEYIICVAFFVAFPIFYQYVDKRKTQVTPSMRKIERK